MYITVLQASVMGQIGGRMSNNSENTYTICENKGICNIQVADEVVCIVAGLAATEVEGVECMSGNITNELVSKLGMTVLSKGVTVEITDKTAVVYISVILKYGYSIPEVSEKIQERVASAIETMTGLTVAEVNIKIAGVKVENNK